MQKKFQGRIISKTTKAELIDEMWFRLLEEIREKAVKFQNHSGLEMPPRMLDLVEVIEDIPKKIRQYVLS